MAAPVAWKGRVDLHLPDNPEVTPPAQCRTDIGINVPVGTLGAGR